MMNAAIGTARKDSDRIERRGERPEIVDLLADGADATLVGGKAAPLARASAAGFVVPPGIVVTTASDGAPRDLGARLARLGDGPFAVRSSAAAEDSASRSFAGQLETILGVAAADVPRAVERCRASASALRVLRYAGSPGEVAVIVQRMVPAEVAGVAFSADPRSGERDVVVVEAVRGLGDRLVGGEVDAERWRCTATGCTRTPSTPVGPVLDAALAARVAEMARALEALFGAPQDVEWAYAAGELFLLQSRPITALPAAPIPIPIEIPEGDWERDDHHAVLSPLGWAWFAAYPKAMARAMAQVMPVKDMRTANVGGHLYVQMVMEGGSGPPPPRWILWLASRLVPALRRANRACAALLDGETYVQTIDAWETEGRRAMAAATDALFVADASTLPDDALLARIDDALAHSGRCLEKHAELHGPGLFALGKVVLFLEDELGWQGHHVLGLVAGSSGKTTELHRAIERIVAEHAGELADAPFPHGWGALFERCPRMAAALAGWLADNRLRVMHYDPKHATLGERPDVVLAIAESIVAGLRDGVVAPAAPTDGTLEEARALLGPDRFAELDRLVAIAKRAYALRDENGIETVSRPSGLLRYYVLELGRRLPLDAPDHAIYLEPAEHGPALRGEITDLRARVQTRRGQESWAVRNRGPRHHGDPPEPPPPADAFPSGLGRVLRIFSWMMRAEAMPEEASGDGPLRGVGIGQRVVTARARVVARPEELVSLRHGEVLVCRITSPEWSVALGRVAAIVTNEGALLSHPAIIAREFGVPAVVGTSAATERIRTGDTVCVDPIDGTVTLVAPGGR